MHLSPSGLIGKILHSDDEKYLSVSAGRAGAIPPGNFVGRQNTAPHGMRRPRGHPSQAAGRGLWGRLLSIKSAGGVLAPVCKGCEEASRGCGRLLGFNGEFSNSRPMKISTSKEANCVSAQRGLKRTRPPADAGGFVLPENNKKPRISAGLFALVEPIRGL